MEWNSFNGKDFFEPEHVIKRLQAAVKRLKRENEALRDDLRIMENRADGVENPALTRRELAAYKRSTTDPSAEGFEKPARTWRDFAGEKS